MKFESQAAGLGSQSQGSGFSGDRQNPYDYYRGKFTDLFDFGPLYARWVEGCMLEALGIDSGDTHTRQIADIGAGTCFWPQRLLRRVPGLHIVAVEPSAVLLKEQCVPMVGLDFDVSPRIRCEHKTAQQFALRCAEIASEECGKFDGIYFMQSGHFIHSSEFPETMRRLSMGLKPGGRLLFQARNLSANWWPWPFPDEWRDCVVAALEPLYFLADRYEEQLRAMDMFGGVSKWCRTHEISLPAEAYWSRLQARWIASLMNESILSNAQLEDGIGAMRKRYEMAGRDTVEWKEVFTFVCAKIA